MSRTPIRPILISTDADGGEARPHGGLGVERAVSHRHRVHGIEPEPLQAHLEDVGERLRAIHVVAGGGRVDRMGERGLLSTVAGFLAQALYARGDYEEAGRFSRTSEEAAAAVSRGHGGRT